MSDSASAQVNAQKRRLIAARAIDESEKRMYVQVLSQGQILSNSSVFFENPEGYSLYCGELLVKIYESPVKIYERGGEICHSGL